MVEKQKPTIKSWDNLLDNYLKATELTQEPYEILVHAVDVGLNRKEETYMRLEVHYNKKKYIFDLNKTNQRFLKDNGIEAPEDVVDKILVLTLVKATDPNTRKEVDSIRIKEIKATH